MSDKNIQKPVAEDLFASELEKLKQWDPGPVPPGWQLSPFAVERFIIGDKELGIERKFVAPKELVNRVIVSLLTERGVMLIGEPGTAKSWLSELLASSISGHSQLTIQGGAISNYRQLLYDWNAALLQRNGPSREALIPGPVYQGMAKGQLVRFEELSRCPQSVQDAILSILSERQVVIPELGNEVMFAREGFNIIATSNSLDRGLFDMSAALKRRLNFETIPAISNTHDEMAIVQRESARLIQRSGVDTKVPPEMVEALVTIFHELRNGQTLNGRSTDRLSAAVMSTAEAVSVAHAIGIYAYYYRRGEPQPEDIVNFLVGTVLKDNPRDRRRVRHYFDTEVGNKKGAVWQTLYEQRNLL